MCGVAINALSTNSLLGTGSVSHTSKTKLIFIRDEYKSCRLIGNVRLLNHLERVNDEFVFS